MNNTLKTMLVAAAALTAVSAQAQDKATLDLLVKKGVITAEERAKTLQSSAATKTESGMDRVFTKEAGANRLTFSGRIQGQWEAAAYTQTTAGVETQAADLNNVMMRRLYLGAKADVGAGFSGELVWNFGDNSNASSTTTTRAPGKKLLALMASNKAAPSLRKSAAGMRVKRISASALGPPKATTASARFNATRMASSPKITSAALAGSGLAR